MLDGLALPVKNAEASFGIRGDLFAQMAPVL
jgi:hypothetical protein